VISSHLIVSVLNKWMTIPYYVEFTTLSNMRRTALLKMDFQERKILLANTFQCP